MWNKLTVAAQWILAVGSLLSFIVGTIFGYSVWHTNQRAQLYRECLEASTKQVIILAKEARETVRVVSPLTCDMR